MSSVSADFRLRCEEVENYLRHLSELEDVVGFDVNLIATMKASAMLMIYNVVESTMANAIESIFDRLRVDQISFADVDDKLKAAILKCAKSQNPAKLVAKMRDGFLDLSVAAFQKDSIFSGNVDAKKIREVLGEYGVVGGGRHKDDALLEVKDARNKLAHGSQSFAELGRSLTANDINSKYLRVKALLSRVIDDVGTHVQTRLLAQAAAQ